MQALAASGVTTLTVSPYAGRSRSGRRAAHRRRGAGAVGRRRLTGCRARAAVLGVVQGVDRGRTRSPARRTWPCAVAAGLAAPATADRLRRRPARRVLRRASRWRSAATCGPPPRAAAASARLPAAVAGLLAATSWSTRLGRPRQLGGAAGGRGPGDGLRGPPPAGPPARRRAPSRAPRSPRSSPLAPGVSRSGAALTALRAAAGAAGRGRAVLAAACRCRSPPAPRR